MLRRSTIVLTGRGRLVPKRIPAMTVFLSSHCLLVAVGLATRRAVRDEGVAGGLPEFRTSE